MKKHALKFNKFLCALLAFLCVTAPAYAYAEDDFTAEPPQEETVSEEQVPYSHVTLSDSLKNFIATVDGDVTLTVISSQTDYVTGDYLEYYSGLSTDDVSYLYEVINKLKAISELNEFIKVEFKDPFAVGNHDFFKESESYELQYGDILISAYANFDGTPKIRHSVLRAKKLFEYKKKNGKNVITGVRLENVIVDKLKNLRKLRDINVAYISDVCNKANIDYLKSYLYGSRYNFDFVTLSDAKLNGYDIVMIADPMRDITLEEIVLLDTFLDNGGKYGKSFLYFPGKNRSLSNFNIFMKKWGVELSETYRLSTNDLDGSFSRPTQLYGKSNNTKYTSETDSLDLFYIMDDCLPINPVPTNGDVRVKTLISTLSDKVYKEPVPDMTEGETDFIPYFEMTARYPLVTASEKGKGREMSCVVTFASVNFITSYFTLQNPDSETDENVSYNTNGNLSAVREITEYLNRYNRAKESGLEQYAVEPEEQGIDTTSGLSNRYITVFAVGGVVLFVIIIAVALFIFDRRRKSNGKNG